MHTSDEQFIDEALKLALKGAGLTNPNPMVGAVIVKNGKIIGRGYHKRFGSPHAEIESIKSVGKDAKGATMYLNLEPHGYHAKTAPCTDAIIEAGIKRVVCSSRDPNPKVHGHGITKLKRAGIAVSVGLKEKEARALNEAFFTFHEKKRPFVAIKFAASLDGKLGTRTGDSKWITNEKSREFARNLRSRYQAILVGVNTVIRDNPHLGARKFGRRDPTRIILDSRLQIPLGAEVLRNNNVLIATTTIAPRSKIERLKERGAEVLVFSGKRVGIKELLSALSKKEIISVLVEGGGEALGSFVDARVVDKVYAFYAPIIIGGKNSLVIGGRGADKIMKALYLKMISVKTFGDNILMIGGVKS